MTPRTKVKKLLNVEIDKDIEPKNQTTEVVNCYLNNCCFVRSVVQDVIQDVINVIDTKSQNEDAGSAQDVISDVIKYVIEYFDQQTTKQNPEQQQINLKQQDVAQVDDNCDDVEIKLKEEQQDNISVGSEQQDAKPQF